MSQRIPWPLLAFLPPLLSSCGPKDAPPALPVLHLEMVSASALPASWRVAAAIPLDAERVALYLHHISSLVWWPDTAQTVRMPHRELVGFRNTDGDEVEAVDAVHHEILRIEPHTGVTSVAALNLPDRIWSAAFANDSWWLLAGDSLEAPSVYRTDPIADRVVWVGTVPGLVAARSLMAATGSGPIVSSVTPPFTVWRVANAVVPADIPEAGWGGSSIPVAATKPVAVGGLAVQTLVDLTSERRLFRLLDIAGGRVRDTEVEAPIAIVASTGTEVVALRYGRTVEVVRYRWFLQ